MTCAPDIEHFPQHLLIGVVDEKDSCKPAQYRYPFIQPPIYNGMAGKISEVKLLFKRLVIMASNFYVPDAAKNDIKITTDFRMVDPVLLFRQKGGFKNKRGVELLVLPSMPVG